MNTPLSSFTALVKFQFDRAGLTSEIAAVRKQLQGLTGSQERSAKQREQSAARSFVSEMRMQRTHAKALRENEAFDRRRQSNLEDWHRKREIAEQKAARDAQAKRLRELRLQDRSAAQQLRADNIRRRAEAAEQTRLNNWLAQRERQERAVAEAQRKRERDRQAQQLRAAREQSRAAAIQMRNIRQLADFQNREYDRTQRNRRRIEQQAQRDTNRLHTEALRENARRDAEAQRRMRQNRPPNTQGGGGSGGNANPWHIGGVAGGLGGLISRGNLAAVGAGAFTQKSFTQANFDIAQVPQFEFITGSAKEAAKQVAFLNKEVDRLSLPLRETSNMYRQLLASTKKGLGIEKTQELFSSFSNISAMLGLSSDAQSRGLRAFAQMASKGQVMS